MEIVIASTNVHKIREFRTLLKKYSFLEVLSLLDFPSYAPPEETAETFRENVSAKAFHAAITLKKWTIADDSGLVVPALNGEPGVLSARYAGEGATDKENCQKLLDNMRSLEPHRRDAYFECWIAVASPDKLERLEKGVCEGVIIEERKGGHGFGYDTLFRKHDYSKTFAELDESIKNRISHRRKSFDKISLYLDTLEEDALLDRRI